MSRGPLLYASFQAPSNPTRAARLVSRASGEAAGRMAASKRSKLQLLFDLAQRTFAEHGQPTPSQVDVLKLALSSVPLAELGIAHSEDCACAEESCPGRKVACSSELQFDPTAHAGPRPNIEYLHIHEDEHLSLGIFCLPANAQIPLHNHPGMTVMSRVLYGKMHVKSFDWADGRDESGAAADSKQQQQQQQQQASELGQGGCGAGATAGPREARRVLNRVLGASDEPAVLFPASGGNIHQFTAVTDCAVLDLLSPPYSTDDGRDCIYYKEVACAPGGEEAGSSRALLEEHEPPEEFTIDSGTYKGLPVRTRPYLLRSILQAAAAAAGGAGPSSQVQAASDSRSQAGGGGGEASSSAANGAAGAVANGALPAGGKGGASTTSPTLSGLTLGGAAAAAAGQPAGSKSPSPPAAKARRGNKKAVRRR